MRCDPLKNSQNSPKTHFLGAGTANLVDQLDRLKPVLARALNMDDFTENKIKAQLNRVSRIQQDILNLNKSGKTLESRELVLTQQLTDVKAEIQTVKSKLVEKNAHYTTMTSFVPHLKRHSILP